MVIAFILLGINIYHLDFENFFTENGKIALIGVLACLIAIVLLLILINSNKIKNKLKDRD
jgi:NhaP-type Na+/H+ or K+/H+ antiporter